jgi:hypothetical protein
LAKSLSVIFQKKYITVNKEMYAIFGSMYFKSKKILHPNSGKTQPMPIEKKKNIKFRGYVLSTIYWVYT